MKPFADYKFKGQAVLEQMTEPHHGSWVRNHRFLWKVILVVLQHNLPQFNQRSSLALG
jgi:hypothetical protein